MFSDEMIYREHLSECARMLTENVAKLSGGPYMTKSLSDIFNPKEETEQTADDIVEDIVNRAGIEVIE